MKTDGQGGGVENDTMRRGRAYTVCPGKMGELISPPAKAHEKNFLSAKYD